MPGWMLVDSQARTFQRPLGVAEHVFFSHGLSNKAPDILRYLELRLLNGAQDSDLFSDANIVRAWLSTKRRYPLAGAVVKWQGQGFGIGVAPKANGDNSHTAVSMEPRFVVRECDLSILRPREIVFGQVADAAEAQRKPAAILHGPRPLSDELLIQLYIFREIGSERARANILHVTVLMAHYVADEMASRALVRCFLDTLARGGQSEPELVQLPLEDRLAMAMPPEALEPTYLRVLSPARRRWRKAIAAVIVELRFAKRQGGGHTLPCHSPRPTSCTPTRSGLIETSLTHAQTAVVIAMCRQYKLTFGHAYLPLAQVAMTRVLYRRYLRGEISEEEWAHRKRQPHFNDAPMSLRQRLDKGWFERGGGGEFVPSISAFAYQLPFMTLGQRDYEHRMKQALPNDAPPFSELLTHDRFLYRAGLIKKQAAVFLKHPLFFEITHAVFLKILEYQRLVTLRALKSVEMGNHDRNPGEDKDLAVVPNIPWVVSHGGASLGNMDLVSPVEYPLPPTHALSPYSPLPHPLRAGYATPSSSPSDVAATPTITVECERLHLQPYSGEVYLGAVTLRGQLKMYVSYDANALEEEAVKEWLDEVVEAVLWYLGPRNAKL